MHKCAIKKKQGDVNKGVLNSWNVPQFASAIRHKNIGFFNPFMFSHNSLLFLFLFLTLWTKVSSLNWEEPNVSQVKLNIAVINIESTGLSTDVYQSNSNAISEATPLNISWRLTYLGKKYQLGRLYRTTLRTPRTIKIFFLFSVWN